MKNRLGNGFVMKLVCIFAIAPATTLKPTVTMAQLPNPALSQLFPPSGQVGSTLDVTVSGRDLDGGERLEFSHPGIEGNVKKSPASEFAAERDVANQFTVHIADNVMPGFYEARVVGQFGLSTSRVFAVQQDRQFVESGNNHKVETANEVTINSVILGRCDANAVDHFRFTATKGQSIAIDCQTDQIDSRLIPIVAVLSEKGRPLVRTTAAADAQLHFDVPTDGNYVIALHDHIYGGGAEHAYRLVVTTAPVIDFIQPSVARPNQSAEFTIHGRNLPDGSESVFSLGRAKLQQKKVRIYVPAIDDLVNRSPDNRRSLGQTTFRYQMTGPNGVSNPYPIRITSLPIITEQEPNHRDAPQQVELPVEFTGTFYPRRDEDCIRFKAKKGQAYHVDLKGHRMGRELDPAVFVWKVTKDDKGIEKLKNVKVTDDRGFDNGRYQRYVPRALDLSDNDPIVTFTADQDGDYCISIRDLYGNTRNDPRSVYRLAVRPTEPDFDLIAWSQHHRVDGNNLRVYAAASIVRPGGTCSIPVDAIRSSFPGDITVKVRDLPSGVKCDDVILRAGKTEAILIATAADDAPPFTGFVTIEGHATIDGKAITKQANYGLLTSDAGNVKSQRPRGRRTSQLAFSVVNEQSPISVRVPSKDVLRTSRGGKLTIPIQYVQSEKAKGDLKVRPFGLPGEIKANEATLKPNAKDGKLELTINNAKTPVGTYSCFLVGQVTANRQRNAKSVASAEQTKKDFETVYATIVQSEQAATNTKNEAIKLRDEQKAIVDENEESVTQATKQGEALRKELADLRTRISSLADNSTSESQLQQNASDKEKKIADADQAVAKSEKAVEKSRQDLKALDKKLEAAEQQLKAAAEKKKRADSHKKSLEDNFNNIKKQHGPKDVVLTVMSPPVTVEIVNSPTSITATPDQIRLKKPEKETTSEVAIKLDRLFGFDDNVDVRIEPPKNQPGFQAVAGQVKKGSDQVSLKLPIKPDAKPGTHSFQIKSKLKFGGVDIEDVTRLDVVIE